MVHARFAPLVFLLGLLVVGCGDAEPVEDDAVVRAEDDALTAFTDGSTDWWSMPDEAFFAEYSALATGSQQERSIFGWLLFARLNQPATAGDTAYREWERWARAKDTFSPSPVWPTTVDEDNRFRQTIKDGGGSGGTEDVTRNRASFDYIVQRGLNYASGSEAIAAASGSIAFTVGAIAVKARWLPGAPAGAYTFATATDTLYLAGMHIMAKIADNPTNDPASPSWYWTTFEWDGNAGRDAALQFVTHRDALDQRQFAAIMSVAGLGSEPWSNYRMNGTQTDFATADGAPVILGNTTMEAEFAIPASAPPSQWTAWNSSCHTCHYSAAASASAMADFGGQQIVPDTLLPNPIGVITLDEGWITTGFEWAIPFNALPGSPDRAAADAGP